MEVSAGSIASTEVVIVFVTDPGHDRFEAGQLVFEILHGVVQDV